MKAHTFSFCFRLALAEIYPPVCDGLARFRLFVRVITPRVVDTRVCAHRDILSSRSLLLA